MNWYVITSFFNFFRFNCVANTLFVLRLIEIAVRWNADRTEGFRSERVALPDIDVYSVFVFVCGCRSH